MTQTIFFVLYIIPRHGPHRKHSLFYCCVNSSPRKGAYQSLHNNGCRRRISYRHKSSVVACRHYLATAVSLASRFLLWANTPQYISNFWILLVVSCDVLLGDKKRALCCDLLGTSYKLPPPKLMSILWTSIYVPLHSDFPQLASLQSFCLCKTLSSSAQNVDQEEKPFERVTLPHIQVKLGSDFDQDIGCSDYSFSSFYSVSPGEYRNCIWN
jgi:hypothetical protein